MLWSIALVFAGLPAAVLALTYVGKYSLDVPVGDQWYDPVHVVIKAHTNQLSVRDLLAMAEGHRPLIIRIIAIAASYAIGLAPKAMSMMTWLCTWINLIVAYAIFSGDTIFQRARAKWIKLVAIFVFSWICFIIHDQQGWIDYYFSTWQFALLFFLGACFSVQRLRGWPAWMAASVCCALSTLSLGIGLGSWIAIPIVAVGFKKHRRLSFLVAWLGTAGLSAWLYQSRFAASAGDANADKLTSLTSLASGNQGGFLAPISNSTKVFILSLSRLWIPAEAWDHTEVPKLIIVFTTLCIAAALTICLRFMAAGHMRTASTWAGISAYSFIGAFLVYLSRRKLMPELRHSAGAEAFWLACMALMIAYVAIFLTNERIISSKAKISFTETLINVRLADKILIPFSVASILLLPILSLAKTATEFRRAPRFPLTCSQKTKHFALLRGGSLRNCFEFIDERSIYQLSLLSLGGLNVNLTQALSIQKGGVLITALPGDLLTAYMTQALLAKARPISQDQQHIKTNVLNLSIKEASTNPPATNPYSTSMDWSGSGKFFSIRSDRTSVDEIKKDIARLTAKHDPIYIAYTAISAQEANQIRSILADNGHGIMQVTHLANSTSPDQGIFIDCFTHIAHGVSAKHQSNSSQSDSKQCFTYAHK
ncbi:MAG: hypothetical protein ACKO45_00720 [Cyanobium sp.]